MTGATYPDLASALASLDAIDRSLGYPRTHTEDEVVRLGGGRHAPIETVRTVTSCDPVSLSGGGVGLPLDAATVTAARARATSGDAAKIPLPGALVTITTLVAIAEVP